MCFKSFFYKIKSYFKNDYMDALFRREDVFIKPGTLFENGAIFLDYDHVGYYVLNSTPPTGEDVENRVWNKRLEEVVCFKERLDNTRDYYVKYKDKWLWLIIKTNLDDSPLTLTNKIYKSLNL